MLFPVHFTPAMKTFLEQRGAVLVPDDSQPTRMVSIKELKELHDARQDAGRLDVSDHRQTSNSSTSSSFATGRTSIFDCQTSITARQTREKMPGESFPDDTGPLPGLTSGTNRKIFSSRGRPILGGGFRYFLFPPRTLGKMNPFWRAYFSKGLVQPPTRICSFFLRKVILLKPFPSIKTPKIYGKIGWFFQDFHVYFRGRHFKGHYMTPTQTMHYYRGNLSKSPYICIKFDALKMGHSWWPLHPQSLT